MEVKLPEGAGWWGRQGCGAAAVWLGAVGGCSAFADIEHLLGVDRQ